MYMARATRQQRNAPSVQIWTDTSGEMTKHLASSAIRRVMVACCVESDCRLTPARGGAAMKRILVVDDDPLVSMSIRLTLEREGFETVSADGGEIGLFVLEDTSFDVMIIDILMPHDQASAISP
jgi:PleD family two-component response regulator